VKELMEGENDGDDEMFWMVVGDSESYAKADYWRWRSSAAPSEPRCWLVDVANSKAPVSVDASRLLNANPRQIRPVSTVLAETIQQESVYIIDCCWEFFVLVGKDARAKRSDITLGIDTAMVRFSSSYICRHRADRLGGLGDGVARRCLEAVLTNSSRADPAHAATVRHATRIPQPRRDRAGEFR
jgi:hypothetical protein